MSDLERDTIGTTTFSDGLSVIGELARSRREKAQEDSERPRSKLIEAVEHSEVAYYFENLAIPFEVLDVLALVEYIGKAYGAKLRPLSVAPLLETMSKDEVMKLEDEELMGKLVRSGLGQLDFEFGKFPLRNDFVIIRSISINFECIIVRISGVTSVAEAIAAEVAEFLWLAAGVTRQWPDIAKRLKLVGYGTSTRVKLDFPAEALLHPNLVTFLEGNLTEGRRYATNFGLTRKSMGSDSKIAAVAKLDEVHIRIDRFDFTTGASESNFVKFSITARNDYGLGRMLVTSPLDYVHHEQFLDQLFGGVRSAPAPDK